MDVGYRTDGKNATFWHMIYSPFKHEMYEALYGKTTVIRIIFYDRPKLLKAEIVFRFKWSQIAPRFMSPVYPDTFVFLGMTAAYYYPEIDWNPINAP